MPICAPVVKKETNTSQQAHVMQRITRHSSKTALLAVALLLPIQGLQAESCNCASKTAKLHAPSQCAGTYSDAAMLHGCCRNRGDGRARPEKRQSCCASSGNADRQALCGCTASCYCRSSDSAPSPAAPAPPAQSRATDDLVQQLAASFCFAASDCDWETSRRPLPFIPNVAPATALKRCISLSRLTL